MIGAILILLIASVYGFVVLYYWRAWHSVAEFLPPDEALSTTISVIIPARNEEAGIGTLLLSLEAQTYPKELFEIIVVDDHSTDRTAEVVKTFPSVKLISLQLEGLNSYKKKALETGIAQAAYSLIVTTDADCTVLPDWLGTIAAYKEKTNAAFIAAPVRMTATGSVLETFQAMDFMILQGITGAVASRKQMSMCNGANLAYEKTVFNAVGGFAGIDEIASGDDMLLMYKISRMYPSRVHYMKATSAVVTTAPMHTWKAFLQQRIRWASKATRYEDKRILPVLLLVYLFNLSFLVMAVAGWWSPVYWILLISLLVFKTLAELPLFLSLNSFFRTGWTAVLFFFFQPMHIIYTIISGLFGQFGKYQWKGRTVK